MSGLIRWIGGHLPAKFYFTFVNLKRIVKGRKILFGCRSLDQLYFAQDTVASGTNIVFCRRRRSKLYKFGVNTRIERLASAYFLDSIALAPNGTFIDCGANVGELGMWIRRRNFDYIPFEPLNPEADCCDLNNFSGERRTVRKALWFEKSTINFYVSPEDGDSSLIDMGYASATVDVPTIRLDQSVELPRHGTGTRILKVEAEGAEPEVLQGAEGLLPAIDYVTVDCGPERGVNCDCTIVEVNSFLSARGFRLIKFNHVRCTALFQSVSRF